MIIPPVRIVTIILFSLAGLALIGIGIWLYVSATRNIPPPPPLIQNETNASIPTTVKKIEQSPTLSEEKETEIAILLTVERFIPTYGSYSGTSNFENYKALFPFMTNNLQKRTQREIDAARARQQQPSSALLSVTTEAGAIKKLQRTPYGKEAEAIVSTFRKEYTSANSYRMFNQDIRLILKEDAGSWLVDDVGWLTIQKN